MKRRGWLKATEYVDKRPGKAGVVQPGMAELMAAVQLRQFDAVLVGRLDCFGRSALETLQGVQALECYGVRLLCPSRNIDSSDRRPAARFTLGLFALIAEFEDASILERTRAGMAGDTEAYQTERISDGSPCPAPGRRASLHRPFL